MQVAAA